MSEGVFTQDPSSVEYIQHHLSNLTLGSGFWSVHADTIVISWVLGAIALFVGWRVGKSMSAEEPSGLQNGLEAIIEFVDGQVRSLFPRADPLVGPMALTIFIWVFLMNFMDIIPVDLLPLTAQWVGQNVFGVPAHEVAFRAVPTADLAVPFAMAITVFLLSIVYGIRAKGLGRYLKGYLTHPFGKYLAPVNVAMSVIEEIAKPLSLALRLFGNLFAGELVFMLIALTGFAWYMAPLQVALGWTWTVFHLLIIVIQAFIFMLLSVVYLALATSDDAH
ncbi:F0F1 ATP synthase subunit A [Salinisphaera sp. SPP-AMP-43]|uniref:F0F1 ATP synthase subunit A n=1 Tax=Salinisphaera sp. SPP-AMP-43 TaxID=3121288 RepID=UPI003C6DB9E1